MEYLFGRLLVENSRWTISSGLCGGRDFLSFVSCRLLRHVGTSVAVVASSLARVTAIMVLGTYFILVVADLLGLWVVVGVDILIGRVWGLICRK